VLPAGAPPEGLRCGRNGEPTGSPVAISGTGEERCREPTDRCEWNSARCGMEDALWSNDVELQGILERQLAVEVFKTAGHGSSSLVSNLARRSLRKKGFREFASWTASRGSGVPVPKKEEVHAFDVHVKTVGRPNRVYKYQLDRVVETRRLVDESNPDLLEPVVDASALWSVNVPTAQNKISAMQDVVALPTRACRRCSPQTKTSGTGAGRPRRQRSLLGVSACDRCGGAGFFAKEQFRSGGRNFGPTSAACTLCLGRGKVRCCLGGEQLFVRVCRKVTRSEAVAGDSQSEVPVEVQRRFGRSTGMGVEVVVREGVYSERRALGCIEMVEELRHAATERQAAKMARGGRVVWERERVEVCTAQRVDFVVRDSHGRRRAMTGWIYGRERKLVVTDVASV